MTVYRTTVDTGPYRGVSPCCLCHCGVSLRACVCSGPDGAICFDEEVPSSCPTPRWPTNANLSSGAHTEWVELQSDHYVPFHYAHAMTVAAKTVEMVQLLRGGN